MRRISVHGLHLQFNTLVTTIRGWSKEPTANEIENILANQDALNKQMSQVLVNEDEKALFSNKRLLRLLTLRDQEMGEN